MSIDEEWLKSEINIITADQSEFEGRVTYDSESKGNMTVVEPQAQNICDEFGCGLQVAGRDVRDRREIETTRRYQKSTYREFETVLRQYSPKREAEGMVMQTPSW